MRPEDVPEELVRVASEHDLADLEEVIAAVISRWEEIRPFTCSFDCSYCRADDDCPCDLAGCPCGGGQQECEPVPCPPFTEATLHVTKMWFGEEHGWLTYDEAVGLELLEHTSGTVTGFVPPPSSGRARYVEYDDPELGHVRGVTSPGEGVIDLSAVDLSEVRREPEDPS